MLKLFSAILIKKKFPKEMKDFWQLRYLASVSGKWCGSREDYTCWTSAPSSTTVYTDLRRSATDFAKIKTIFMRHVFILWQSLLQVTSVNVFFSHSVWFVLGLQRLFKTNLFVQMAWIFRNNFHSLIKKKCIQVFCEINQSLTLQRIFSVI